MPARTPRSPSTSVVSRRAALRLAASVVSALALGACQSPTAQPSPTGAGATAQDRATSAPAASTITPPTAPAPQSRRGGTLRLAQVGDVASLDGHLASRARRTARGRCTTVSPPTTSRFNRSRCWLRAWEVAATSKQIVLHLRKGVQFHNGREFTSDDVKYNLLRVRTRRSRSGSFVNQSNWFTAIDTPDKYTVVLKSDAPRPGCSISSSLQHASTATPWKGPTSRPPPRDRAVQVCRVGPGRSSCLRAQPELLADWAPILRDLHRQHRPRRASAGRPIRRRSLDVIVESASPRVCALAERSELSCHSARRYRAAFM